MSGQERESRAQGGAPGPQGGAPRPLRADARRNRAKILAVADRVFTARGTGVSTEEVAREAEVGIGTVFRHFPTKEALLAAVFVARFEELAATARGLADAPDPGAAFFGFLASVARQSGAKNAFASALEEAGLNISEVTAPVRGLVRASLGTLLERARQAGAVRADLGVADVEAVMVGASRAAEYAAAHGGSGDRAVALVLDGLRRHG